MKCKNCGSDIDQNAKFCGQCGTPVEFEEELIENCTEDIKEEKQVKENNDIQEKLDEIVEEVTNEDDSEKSFENADGERIENTSELFEGKKSQKHKKPNCSFASLLRKWNSMH